MSDPPEISLFFGRLHPALVHLPIGLIFVLAGLELMARWPRFKTAGAGAGFILALAVPAAIATALCGWLLSRAGGYDDRLLQWHKWTGIGTAAICVLAAVLYRLDLKKPYRWCLFAGTAALVVSSHFGGSLTHGSDYLTRYAPQPFRSWLGGGRTAAMASVKTPDPAAAPAFTALVQPILNAKCVMCHGPEKAKAGLRLDAYAEFIKGGDSGVAIVPGKSGESLALKRLSLPEEDENHMPPDGKPQPTPDEIALLRWWVDAGASANAKAAELKPSTDIARIIASRSGARAPAEKAPPAALAATPPDPDLAQAERLGSELDIAISLLSAGQPWLQCNASIAGTNFGDAQLAKLAPLGANVRWLDLAGTRITDAGLASLASMPNLARLHLERSAVTDAGLDAVSGLANLEYLNLYGTAVSDAGLESLKKLPHLKQLYLWQTKVTATGGQAFAESRIDRAGIEQWETQIRQLQARIRDAHLSVDLGTPLAPVAQSTNTTAANTTCPVSGKPVDPAKTVVYEGRLVAFCCDDCKAQFQKDPKPYLAKLDGLTPKSK